MSKKRLARVSAVSLLFVATTFAFEPPAPRRAIQILEFVSHDYAKAVRTREADEVQEQVENLEHAAGEVRALPDAKGRAAVLALIAKVQALVKLLTPQRTVSAYLTVVETELAELYPCAVAAPRAVSLANGRKRYVQACASCHGADGRSLTPAAKTLRPRPPRLDSERLRPLSPEYLYDTITYGVVGTAMPAFGAALSEQDRWDIVYQAYQLAGVSRKPVRGAPKR